MSWSLTTCLIDVEGSPRQQAAIRRADGRFVVPSLISTFDGLVSALEARPDLAVELQDVDVDALPPIDAIETVPLSYPRKVLCVGANYRDHISEMGVSQVPEGVDVYFFLVPPTTTLVASGHPVLIPDDPAYRIDWEAELAVVIGRGGRDIALADVPAHIAGYACFNDVTARGLLRRKAAVAPPFDFDWLLSKGQDTFCPIGPITPAWRVPDPSSLTIRCLVNGELKQDGSTSTMVAGVSEIVAAASRHFTLEPGDVIATGTPAGVGQSRGEQLVDGDVVRVEISGLAPLENRFVHRSESDGSHNDVVLHNP